MSHVPSPRSLRGALLGAVALAALGGVAFEGAFAPNHALAAATQSAAGPASFADIVDRVKPAVVSVKVQIPETVSSEVSPLATAPSCPGEGARVGFGSLNVVLVVPSV